MDKKREIDFGTQMFGGYAIKEVERFVAQQIIETKELQNKIEVLESKVQQQQRVIEDKNRFISQLKQIKGTAERALVYQQLQQAQESLQAVWSILGQDFSLFVSKQSHEYLVTQLERLEVHEQAIALHMIEEKHRIPLFSSLRQSKKVLMAMAKKEHVSLEEAKAITAKIRQEGTSHVLDTVYEGGIDKTAKILSSIESMEALKLLSEVAESDKDIGRSLRERCLFFDDLERLHQRYIVTLIREIDRSDLLWALSACPQVYKRSFFQESL